ncbi:MAG: beta-ketoacyl-ACP synthase I [Kistimonas sp.]|nr:beta-ketoacyl-ACP synthase I [Kistimonas sp.]
MRRVVVTGIGITSCLGNDAETVTSALRQGLSGIKNHAAYKEKGLRSHVVGAVKDIRFDEHIDRKSLRFMGDAAAYSYIAMQQAIADAGLEPEQISTPRTGLIAASGGASTANIVDSTTTLLDTKSTRKIGPFRVTRTMGNTISACLATPFGIKGLSYSITSACATSAHCIGNAMEQIQAGKQDIVFAGGGEEEHWSQTAMFDAMGALSSRYNETPEKASRAYDAGRDGFVIAGGAGILVLEEREHALARGAKIYAEVTGYGATSDGHDMVAPSGEGAVRCMNMAMETAGGPLDYINTHGTSTPIGDMAELKAIRTVFPKAENCPLISSTKSLSGHSLGAAGAHEAIYCLLMMQNGFVAASANIENLDPQAEGLPIVCNQAKEMQLHRIMSNSFGFGGTNACLIFERHD